MTTAYKTELDIYKTRIETESKNSEEKLRNIKKTYEDKIELLKKNST